MKKSSIFCVFAGLLSLAASAFVSCDDGEIIEKHNTLKVSPKTAITLKASGNEDVVLNVETDAETWSVEKTDWILAKQDGATLKVNAEANTTDAPRPGRIIIKAGNATPVKIDVMQEIAEEGETVLSVTPSDAITFEAKGNKAVELTVTTTAKDWSFTAPDWIDATKAENKLSVNAKDNAGDERNGEIVFKTSESDAVVKIAVSQKAGAVAGETVVATVKVTDKAPIKFTHNATEPVVKVVTVELDKATSTNVSVKFSFDAPHVMEYNLMNDTEFETFPEKLFSVENDGVLTINAGETSANINVTLTPGAEIAYVTEYMVPVKATAQSANVTVNKEATYANFFVSKVSSKKLRNICYFEVNDCNPLNALELILEDGQPFFDAVVLFAGNINWNSEKEEVYMNANPNVRALLDGTDVYLQPLRKKGIKVLLDILGNHDQAGLAGLSDYGCQKFGEHLAQVCLDYKLDGFGFDDEYSNYGGSGQWFTSPSSQQAARLCYETKKAMTKLVPWETWMHLYYLGYIHSGMPSVNADGAVHEPGSFIDNVCADYNQSASPVKGMGINRCAGTSIQLNYGGSMSAYGAKNIMDQGYGWIMWFAYDPSGTGTVSSNRSHSFRSFNETAQGCYNQKILPIKNVYNKISEGVYDPTPHPVQ